MRLTCEVHLSNRLLPTLNMKKTGKAARCQLVLGKKPASIDKTIYLMVATSQHPSGTILKVYQNVQGVFCKFVEQGKANIRIKEPTTDVLISKADVSQLKAFLRALKAVISKGVLEEASADDMKLSCLTPVTGKALDKLKTKTSILERKNYPIIEGFAPTLVHLQINNCSLKRLDNRILTLKHLSTLDMSNNKLTAVPSAIQDLSLSSLTLTNNLIELFDEQLCGDKSKLSSSLRTLDVSDNISLIRLPSSIVNLASLHTLRADRCSLAHFPSQLGKLSSLKVLSVSENKLQTLPYSFLKLRLDELNLYGNPFLKSTEVKSRLSFPSLGELSARVIKYHKLAVKKEYIGFDLWTYLSAVKWCPCGKPCFVSFACYLAPVDLRTLVNSSCHCLNSTGGSTAPLEAYLCSHRCLSLYRENPKRRKW